MDDLKRIERSALTRLQRAKSSDAVAKIRAEFLGKKGKISQALKTLGQLSSEERPKAGKKINEVKAKIEQALQNAFDSLKKSQLRGELVAGGSDVTLPGRRRVRGLSHPLRLIEQEVIDSLTPLGFEVASGPLVEHDWYNFEALNFPPDHPARDMQDTFFVGPNELLRTHTSNVQIRVMNQRQPPVRILAPGMVFRHDEVDPTHSPVFHQVEGFWVDEKATFADLKGVVRKLACDLFGPKTAVRFRPSFFPFTEPSAEMDISCVVCKGIGQRKNATCRVCSGTGWLEILGAGMVHPAVLEAVGYDINKYQGFAFGAGIERIAMLRWGIDDIRLFFENDLRFLQQFSGRIGV